MRILTYAVVYAVILAVLIALNHLMHRWYRGDDDEAARREIARFRSYLPPGNENDIYERPSVSNHPQREKARSKSANAN